MLGICLFFIIILSISFSISVFAKENLALTIFPSVCLIILCIYVFGIINLLNIGCILVVLFSVLSILYVIKNRNMVKQIINIPALVFFALLFIIAIVFFRNAHLHSWDEFTHWGIYVKNMFAYKTLGNDKFTSIANSYPPAISILQYFVVFLQGEYRESLLYMSLWIFTICTTMPLLKSVDIKKDTLKLLLFSIIAIIFPSLFVAANAMDNIYVDVVSSMIFIYCILSIMNKEISIFNIFCIFVATSVLILVKDITIVFAGVIYLVLIYNVIFIRKAEYIDFYKRQNKKQRSLIILCFLLPVIMKLSWMLYIKFNVNISNSYNMIKFVIPTYASGVTRGFLATIFINGIRTTGTIIYIPTIYWIIISIFLVFMMENKDDKRIMIFTFIITSIFYLLFLLLSYIFLFSQEEALKLASFERYLITYILSILGIIAFYVIKLYNEKALKDKYTIIITAFIIFFGCGYWQYVNEIITFRERPQYNFYSGYSNIENIQKEAKITDKIYYISIDNFGVDYYISKYLITPLKIDNNNNNDLYNKGKYIETDKFIKFIKNYDYIYIFEVDDNFIKKYNEIFEDNIIQEKTVYKQQDGKLYKIN